MKYRFSPAGAKDLRSLDRSTRSRILAALERLATTEYGDVKALQGEHKGTYRLRVGKWRIFYSPVDETTMEVFRIDNRGQAY